MTERERLIEEYEDAFFAVLMHDLAEYEGKKLIIENDNLKNDPAFEVPDYVHKRSLSTIRRAMRKEKVIRGLKFSKRAIYKVAVVFLIASVLFTSAYASVPSFRARTLNLLIEISDVSALLTMSQYDNVPDATNSSLMDEKSTLLGYSIPHISSGYSLSFSESNDNYSATLYYLDSDGNYILISVTNGDHQNHNIDTEKADRIEQLAVSKYDVILVTKDGERCATLADTDKGYFISIYASNISREEILLMLEEMLHIAEY